MSEHDLVLAAQLSNLEAENERLRAELKTADERLMAARFHIANIQAAATDARWRLAQHEIGPRNTTSDRQGQERNAVAEELVGTEWKSDASDLASAPHKVLPRAPSPCAEGTPYHSWRPTTIEEWCAYDGNWKCERCGVTDAGMDKPK